MKDYMSFYNFIINPITNIKPPYTIHHETHFEIQMNNSPIGCYNFHEIPYTP